MYRRDFIRNMLAACAAPMFLPGASRIWRPSLSLADQLKGREMELFAPTIWQAAGCPQSDASVDVLHKTIADLHQLPLGGVNKNVPYYGWDLGGRPIVCTWDGEVISVKPCPRLPDRVAEYNQKVALKLLS